MCGQGRSRRIFPRWPAAAAAESPTTAIYFSTCMDGAIGPVGSDVHSVWRLSPNVFYVPRPGDPCVLVIRDWDRQARARLARLPRAQIRYLLDDDIWAGAADRALPWAYRRRLRALSKGNARRLLEMAARIYVPSERLRERLGRHEATRLVQPGLVQPAADLAHHEEPGLRLVFAGTRAHLGDLAMIAQPLAEFLRRRPDCRLETFLGRYAPSILRLPNAVHHTPQSWAQYRHTLARRRYHAALAPAEPTAFNAARSPSKLAEFACFGAAPVCSGEAPFAGMVEAAQAGFLCTAEADAWSQTLTLLAEDRPLVRQKAAANAQLAGRMANASALRAFWHEEFGLPATR